MIKFIKSLFGSKPEETAPVVSTVVEAANQAPYKVESVAEKAVEAVVESVAPAKKTAPKKQYHAKKAPATTGTKQPARKPKAK